MRTEMDFEQARGLLLERVLPVGRESVPLEQAAGRVLAEPLCAAENVPAFDRSPYDGYALRAADVRAAGREAPVALRILEEIAAGGVSHVPVTEGTCVKILTGAPIPPGADCVEMYENTAFDAEKVTFFAPRKAGENIIRAGEDVRAGMHLAEAGETIDPGLAGTLAAQGCARPLVYARPRIALLSTGSELVEVGEEPGPGMIRNSNRYTLTAALAALGCEAVYYGIAGDRTEDIAARLERALDECDAAVLTGGVSVGDYDRTPAAMEAAGCEILVRGVRLKPGGACCYGMRNGKFAAALSGNPASAMTNFYAIAAPALKKLAGRRDFRPRELTVSLAEAFGKKSRMTRLVRGRLELAEDGLLLRLPANQGNVVLSSMIGIQAMAVIPGGSGPLAAGEKLKGFLL